MRYRILLVALESELPYKQAPKDYKVVYTGVGKVNAAFAATQAIAEAHSLGFHPEVFNRSKHNAMFVFTVVVLTIRYEWISKGFSNNPLY